MSCAISVAPLREVMRAGLPALTNMFSPTKNPCVVKTTPMKGAKRFRYDPYRATVLTASPQAKPQSPVSFCAPAVIAPYFVQPYAAMMHPMPVLATAPVTPFPLSYMMSSMQQHTTTQPPSVMNSCETSPVPSVVPTRTTTPAPIATTHSENAVLSSSISSLDDSEHCDKHFAIVKFKHDTYPYLAPFRVAAGDIVIVEGDRGESIATVKEVTQVKPNRPVACRIVRKATQKDKDTLAMLRRKEAAATKFCENAVKDLGIDMSIVDTEYQFDQNKLSIYFKSKGMVDFRRLQRVLFREFRCRVWLVNWNELVTEC